MFIPQVTFLLLRITDYYKFSQRKRYTLYHLTVSVDWEPKHGLAGPAWCLTKLQPVLTRLCAFWRLLWERICLQVHLGCCQDSYPGTCGAEGSTFFPAVGRPQLLEAACAFLSCGPSQLGCTPSGQQGGSRLNVFARQSCVMFRNHESDIPPPLLYAIDEKQATGPPHAQGEGIA